MKKTIKNLIFFILLIILTFSIIFKDQNISEIMSIINHVKKEYLIIAVLCMCAYILCDALNIGRTLRNLKEKSNFIKNVKYSLIGFFFSGITPAASGGQPMQIYYMHKDNISVGNSTLALLVNLSCMQIVTISLALISFAFNCRFMEVQMLWFFAIGIFLNICALALILISLLSRKATKWIIDKFVGILRFFKVKSIEEKQKRIEDELRKYQSGARYIKHNAVLMIKTLIFTYIQYIFLYAISYFVYRSFGLKNENILQLISLQAVLCGTVSGIPSPGAVGVSEGGYMSIYSRVYGVEILSSAMLLTRVINFYLFILISSIVVIVNDLKGKKQIEQQVETE